MEVRACECLKARVPGVNPKKDANGILSAEGGLMGTVAQETDGRPVSPVQPDGCLTEDEREKLSWIGLTRRQAPDLQMDEDALSLMGPLEITDRQWNVLTDILLRVSYVLYGQDFASLSQKRKIRAVWAALAGTGSELVVMKSRPDGDMGNISKAAEFLSKRVGDCDDLALLYMACVKRLGASGLIDAQSIGMATVDYYDPAKQKVSGHANVIHTVLEENAASARSYIVELALRPKIIEMDMHGNGLFGKGNQALMESLMENLNSSRVENISPQGKLESRERRLEEFVEPMRAEWLFYTGFEAAELYYCETKGQSQKMNGEFEKAIDTFTRGIAIAEKAGLEKANCLVCRGNSYGLLFYETMRKHGVEGNVGRMIELRDREKADYYEAAKTAGTICSIKGTSMYYLYGTDPPNRHLAEELLQRGIQMASYHCELHLMMGRARLGRFELDKAGESVQKAIDLLELMSGEPQEYQNEMKDSIKRTKLAIRLSGLMNKTKEAVPLAAEKDGAARSIPPVEGVPRIPGGP